MNGENRLTVYDRMPISHVPVHGEKAVNPLGFIYEWDSIWGWFNTGVRIDGFRGEGDEDE